MASFMQNYQQRNQPQAHSQMQHPRLNMPIGQGPSNQSPMITPPVNLIVPQSSSHSRQHAETMYGGRKNNTQNTRTNIKASNSSTLTASQIHGRKIDSPKIHVKEVGDNRPKTSAQHIRKYTLNESQQLSNLNVQNRKGTMKQGRKGKDNARTVQQKFSQAGISSTSAGKNTKSLLMTQMGLTAPLTNKETKKFDFESTKTTKQSQTPHPSNVKSQKQKLNNLPPKQTRNQGLSKVSALKSAMKTTHLSKKRHSSQGGVHTGITTKSSTTAVPSELLSPHRATKPRAKNSQKNQNSFGGLPSQSSRTGRTNNYQGGAGQVASTIAASQAKRGRRTKSENRYTKKQTAQRHQKASVHQKLRRSGEIIGSPLSDSLLSSKSQKRTKSPSGSHPELRKKLTMFNQSVSCGRAPQKKEQQAQDLLSLSSMSSASAGHLQKRVDQQKVMSPGTVGQQQAAGQSFSRLFGKSYFVDGEQFLRHMSPGTPSGSTDADQMLNTTKIGQRAISVTHRPNSKAGKVQVSIKHSKQSSSEMLGKPQFSVSKSIELDNRNSTQQQNQIKSAKHTLNMLSMLSNKAASKSNNLQTEKTKESHSFLNLTQKISTSSTKQSKSFDKMIKQNIKRKNKAEAEETLKKFIQETKKAQKKEELTQRNQEIQRLNALRNNRTGGETSLRHREDNSNEAKRMQAFSINQQKTPQTNKARSRSCIEKFFSGSSIRHQAPPPPINPDTSVVLEIKQLKREINEEMRNDTRNFQPRVNSSHNVNSVVEEKVRRIDRKKNSSNNELHIDQGRIHKFIMKQKRNRIAKQQKEETIEEEKQIRRRQNLQDLDNFTRDGYKRKPSPAQNTALRNSVNFKKDTSLSIKKQMDLLKNSTQPLRHNHRSDQQRNDLNQFMDPDYPSHDSGQEYDEEKNTLLMDDGDKQIINIYKKIPDEHRRKNSSSKSRKRDMSNSRSNSSPGRFISSESKRKQQQAQKILHPKFAPLQQQRTQQPSHPLRHRPKKITNSSIERKELDVQVPHSVQRSQDPSSVIYQTLDKSENKVDIDPFPTIDPPNDHPSLHSWTYSPADVNSDPRQSNASHYSQPPSRHKRNNSKTDSQTSEVKVLIKNHSAAITIQCAYRFYLRKRGWYNRGYYSQKKEDPYKELQIDVKMVSEPGTTSPVNIPPLRLDSIGQKKDPYQPLARESERPESTARSVFERNDFEVHIRKMEEKGLLRVQGNGKVSTKDFPELLKSREEAIQQYEVKRTTYIQQKFERKQYSPRTYEVEKRAIEVWVQEERKEVKKRKKAFEKEQVKMFREVNQNETNQKALVGFFPALEPKTYDPRLPSSHSYRTGGPASSRREMSSSRIIDMINEPVKGEYPGRPVTPSSEQISQGPGPANRDLSVNSSNEYYSQPKTPSEPSEQFNFNDIDVKDPLKEVKNPEVDDEEAYSDDNDHHEVTENSERKQEELNELQLVINSPSSMDQSLRSPLELIPPPHKKNEIRSFKEMENTPVSSDKGENNMYPSANELKRSAGSTELHTADLGLAECKAVSPCGSDVGVGRHTEPIGSSNTTSSNLFINNIEKGKSSEKDYALNQTEQEGGNFAVEQNKLSGQSPRAGIGKSGGFPNIRIEIGGKDTSMSPEGEVKTNVMDLKQKPISPMSEGSDLGIEIGANSIKSDSSVADDFTKVRIEPEDPHLIAQRNSLAQAKLELKDPAKAREQRVSNQLEQFGEEFTNEIFNLLITELHMEMDVMVNRNAPSKGIFKQNQGIKTDLFAIEKYIDEVQTEMIKPANKQQFIEAISAPLNKNAVAQMEQMQDSKTGSFTHFIDTFPQVLPLDLYLTLEKRRKEAREKQIQDESKASGVSPAASQTGNGEVSSTFIAECEHIHNKVLFDCINDSLLQFKPYSKEGQPMPWSRHTKRLKPADDFTIQETFEIVKHDLFRAAITQAGLLPRREFIIKGVFDEEIFGEFREKKLVSLLAHEMIENENKWLNYEFEEAQVKIDVGDIVLEQLVQEAIGLLQKNQDREF